MEFPLKAVLESVLIGVISALLVMILFFIPILNIAVLLFPIPLVVVGVRRGMWAGVLGLIISSAILSIIMHPFLGIVVFILNVCLVAGLSWAFKKKMHMNECIILSSGGVLISILASLQAFSLMVGKSFFEFIWDTVEQFFVDNSDGLQAVIKMYENLGILDNAHSVEEFTKLLIGQMRSLMPLVPSIMLISSIIIGAMVFLLSRLVLKRFRLSVPAVPLFRNWALPKGTGRGFLTIMLIALVGMFAGLQNFDMVFYTISALFSFIFAIQGLATAAFFLKMGKLPDVVQVLILIAAFIFMSAALTFIGVFEEIFRFRRAYSSRPRG